MHDLNTINRLNAEAFVASIHKYRTQGRYVLARYEGMTLVSIETFSELIAAQMLVDAVQPNAGERVVIFAPIPVGNIPRDQSEDRTQPYSLQQLAALGRTGEKTLGDYIARKSQLLDNPKD